MATKKQIPRKHSNKRLNNVQEDIVKEIQVQKGHFCSWLEAKHEYCENQSKYDTKNMGKVLFKEDQPVGIAQEIADTTPMPEKSIGIAQEIVDTTDIKKKRVLLKLKETKLGVTLVLNLEECEALGFTGEELTKEVIVSVRGMLGLKPKKVKK